MITSIHKITLFVLLLFYVTTGSAQNKEAEKNMIEVHKLQYLEREPGVDDYQVTILVSNNRIRIDETGEGSGYIVFDNEKKVIYSISKNEQSILVINEHGFNEKKSPAKYNVEYEELVDAPTVGGKKIFNYRVYTTEGDIEEICMEIQLVENLLPGVRALLRNYQKVISGQQVKMTDNKITQEQTACYFADQIYNSGAYYEKGLPIQEWHSNDRSKILQTFKKIVVDKSTFNIPEDYHQFSIDKESKTFIN